MQRQHVLAAPQAQFRQILVYSEAGKVLDQGSLVSVPRGSDREQDSVEAVLLDLENRTLPRLSFSGSLRGPKSMSSPNWRATQLPSRPGSKLHHRVLRVI